MSVSVLKHVASVSIQVCEHVVPSCFACQCPALSLSSINITAGIAETGRAKIREQDRRRRRKKKKYCTNNCVDFGYFWVMAFKHWTLGDCQFVVVQAYRIGDHISGKIKSLHVADSESISASAMCAGRRRLPFRRTRRSPRQTSVRPLDCITVPRRPMFCCWNVGPSLWFMSRVEHNFAQSLLQSRCFQSNHPHWIAFSTPWTWSNKAQCQMMSAFNKLQ